MQWIKIPHTWVLLVFSPYQVGFLCVSCVHLVCILCVYAVYLNTQDAHKKHTRSTQEPDLNPTNYDFIKMNATSPLTKMVRKVGAEYLLSIF